MTRSATFCFGLLLALAQPWLPAARAQAPAPESDALAQAHALHEQLLTTPSAARRPEQYQAIVDVLAAAWADPGQPQADDARFEAAAIYVDEARDLRDESAYKQASVQLLALLKTHPYTAYRRNAEWALAQIEIFHLHQTVAANDRLRDFETRYPADPRVAVAQQELRGRAVPEPAYLDAPAAAPPPGNAVTPLADAEPALRDTARGEATPAPGAAHDLTAGRSATRSFDAALGPITTLRLLTSDAGVSLIVNLKGEAGFTRGAIPESHRVYFDLRLAGTSTAGPPRTFAVHAGGIESIHVAEFEPGVVRLVLTLSSARYQADAGKFFPNPSRLVIAIRPR